MRIFLIGVSIAALIALGGAFAYFRAERDMTAGIVDLRGKSEVNVVLTEKGFEPRMIRITEGTKVTFTSTHGQQFWPASDPHPTHTDYPQFDPKEPIMPSGSWSFVFDRIGRWGYHDHLRSYFTGVIYVDAQP